MKQINLLPWREYKDKLNISQFFLVWFGVSCSCIFLLFIAKILINQQTIHYQLASDSIFLQIKTLSPTMQKIKQLRFALNELQKIVKSIQANHQQIKKILDFIIQLNYLITPDIFVRFIEFNPPYLNLVMHANSEKKYLTFIKSLQLNDLKLQWWILNKSPDLYADFVVQMLFDKK